MKQLIMRVMSYPLSYVPPGWEVPEGYVPEGRIEDYDVILADASPEAGQQFDFFNHSWTIAQVQAYQSPEQARTGVEGFYLAICTLDGSLPVRTPWHSGTSPLLVIHALTGGDLVANEWGDPYWELVKQESWITAADGLEIKSFQHFEPVGERLAGDYSQVVVAWSEGVNQPSCDEAA